MKFNAPNIAYYCTKYNNKLNINFVWDMQLIPYNLYVLEMFFSVYIKSFVSIKTAGAPHIVGRAFENWYTLFLAQFVSRALLIPCKSIEIFLILN